MGVTQEEIQICHTFKLTADQPWDLYNPLFYENKEQIMGTLQVPENGDHSKTTDMLLSITMVWLIALLQQSN
jgi:hypothetical protein